VIIVASVSSIYNLGSPEDYSEMLVSLEEGQKTDRMRRCENLLISNTNVMTSNSPAAK